METPLSNLMILQKKLKYYCKYLKIEFQINKLKKSIMLTKIAPQF
jgi:hypothetical protein